MNLEAPPFAQAALVRCMLYPSLCLAAAEVRRALLLLGADVSLGQELVALAADGTAEGPRMFDCFAPTELQVCVQIVGGASTCVVPTRMLPSPTAIVGPGAKRTLTKTVAWVVFFATLFVNSFLVIL